MQGICARGGFVGLVGIAGYAASIDGVLLARRWGVHEAFHGIGILRGVVLV